MTGVAPGYGPPPRRTGDAVVSGIALVVAGAVVAMGVLGGVFLVAFLDAFLDDCRAPRCSTEDVYTAVGGALAAAALVAIVGMAVTIRRLVRRRPAWPFALVTLVVCVAAVVVGWYGFRLAAGV